MKFSAAAVRPQETRQHRLLHRFLLVVQVMLRVKESEVQYLKQEINSLKDELQAAQRVNNSDFFILLEQHAHPWQHAGM